MKLRFTLYTLLLFIIVPALAAQTPVSDDEVNAVAKGLYCPVCESTPLDVCPTQACADWREVIRTQLSEGRTPAEINEYFARQYGDGVLAAPPRRGVSLVLWLFPLVALIIGGFFFSRYLGTLKAGTTAVTPTAAPATTTTTTVVSHKPLQHYIDQVEQQLEKNE